MYLLITMCSDKHDHYLDEDIPIRKLILPYEKEKADKKSHMFLKGPIPYPLLIKASKLPGKALHVFIILWFLYGMTKNKTINLKNSTLREFGIQRHAGYRALKVLEKVFLVSVIRCVGKNPQVTINCNNRSRGES